MFQAFQAVSAVRTITQQARIQIGRLSVCPPAMYRFLVPPVCTASGSAAVPGFAAARGEVLLDEDFEEDLEEADLEELLPEALEEVLPLLF